VRLAAVREAREEAGIEIRLDALVGIYSYAGSTPVVIVYGATWTGGELAVDDENSEIRTFATADLPWSEMAFRSTREALEDYLSGREAISSA
jgi:8-oxo-dGTP pyrophosphatase MutT (NUDIX family)